MKRLVIFLLVALIPLMAVPQDPISRPGKKPVQAPASKPKPKPKPKPNLIPTEGTENKVTLKEDEGEFEASARLAQAYGFNLNTTSYFMADFGKEPVYNGPYTLTVSAEAFCDEVWKTNHNFGSVNEEIVFHFNIVDGQTSGLDEVQMAEDKKCEIYTIDGIRLNKSVEELTEGLYIINGKKVSIK